MQCYLMTGGQVKSSENQGIDKRAYYRNVYLNSDHWKHLKAQALAANACCAICFNRSTLEVHHRHYRNLYDVTLDDLAVLCRECHRKIHRHVDGPGVTGWIREALLDQALQLAIIRRRKKSQSQLQSAVSALR